MKRTAADWFFYGLTLVNTALLAFVLLAGSHVPPSPGPTPTPVPVPTPTPVVDTVSIGHAYGVTLAHTYGDAWLKAADDVDAGKTITEAQTDMQTSWAAARADEGARLVTPILTAIIPQGSEGDTTSRPKWSKAARDLATGLKVVK